MIKNSNLKYLTSCNDLDFYEFKTSLFNYFAINMAYYEKLFSRRIRETMDYIKGGYHVVYIARKDILLGYGIVVKGGGRYKFCTKRDNVICSLWVQPEFRGKGYLNTLLTVLSDKKIFPCNNFYEYIAHSNIASIKGAEKNNFRKISNAEYVGIFHNVKTNSDGHLGIYKK